MRVAGRPVGEGRPCFIIAEAGVNHDGRLAKALALVDAAADAGADAVKFQTFDAEKLAAPSAPKAGYQARATGKRESQLAMLKRLELSREAHRKVAARCRRRRILFLSTPFDEGSADFLETLGMPAFKVPSGELTNLPFLAHLARKRRPMIVSTGMATLEEVRAAMRTIRGAGAPPVALLHCVSRYPAEPADANLRAMDTLRRAFRVPVGYSDHTLGLAVPTAAAALGACVIEKHFTLDKRAAGPDHAMSLDPAELAALVAAVRAAESALGDGRKRPAASESETARVARKSLVAARDIAAGERLSRAMIVCKRPGTGLPPAELPRLLGRRARRRVRRDELLSRGQFA